MKFIEEHSNEKLWLLVLKNLVVKNLVVVQNEAFGTSNYSL